MHLRGMLEGVRVRDKNVHHNGEVFRVPVKVWIKASIFKEKQSNLNLVLTVLHR